MSAKAITTAAIVAVLATGCATSPHGYRPVVDHGRSSGNYEQDLAECQQLATQRASQAQSAGAGALLGALFGAALGAAAGLDSNSIGKVAGVGAVHGVAAGASNTDQRDIVTRCVQGRGWNVVGGA